MNKISRIIIVILIFMIATTALAQGEVIDQDTMLAVQDRLVDIAIGVAALAAILAVSYITGRGSITKENTIKSALTLADLLETLERLDLTDEDADEKIDALEQAIRSTAEKMGTDPKYVLVKD